MAPPERTRETVLTLVLVSRAMSTRVGLIWDVFRMRWRGWTLTVFYPGRFGLDSAYSMKVTARDLAEAGVIAIVRASNVEVVELLEAAKALCRGGVRAMEVTLNTPGALGAIGRIREEVEAMWCGAGTVICADDVVEAIGAGAQFVVTPVVDVGTIGACVRRGVPVIPGCVSANEAVAANRAGAELVKVFPASRFGVSHWGELLEELPMLGVVPTGGVTVGNVGELFRAGCAAVGVGSNLVSGRVLAGRDWAGLESAARAFVDAVTRSRGVNMI